MNGSSAWAPTREHGGKRRWHKLWSRTVLPWLFVAPLVFFNAVVILAPSVGSVAYAFTDWSGLGSAHWVGLANFQRLLSDPIYHKAFANNAKFTLIFLTVPVAMGLFGAALLAPVKRGHMLLRVGFFMPSVIASVVNAGAWRNILHPTRGVGAILAERGLTFMNISFFGSPKFALYSIAVITNWQRWGFLVVLYLAAMQAVNVELYESARIEGANRWQEFRFVTLPGILPNLVFTVLMSVIWSFLTFDYIYLITQGGPAHASDVLATVLFRAAFQQFEAGYAAAIGVTMSLVCALVVAMFAILRGRGWEL